MDAPHQALSAQRQANLIRLLKPRHIAFIGGRSAETALRICRNAGFAGEIHAVSASRDELAGVPCVGSVAELPVAPDAAFVAVPAAATVETVAELARIGAGGAVCFASGFAELGAEGAERARLLVEAGGSLALVGPNCFGMINYVSDASMWMAPYPPGAGPRGAAIIGQSGNVCINLSMSQRHVPFSYIISAGNQAVLGFEDYIDVLIDDENVSAIGLFMEGIRNVPRFSAACLRALEQGVPVIAYRVGVSQLGAQLAASHTSSLAGQNELYDALFERLRVIDTASVPQFLEMLKAASLGQRPGGRRVAVFSSSGGDNGMAADYLSLAGLDLPQPDEAQVSAIKPLIPDYAQVGNPLDFTAGYWGAEDRLVPIFTAMLRRGYDQAVLVIDHPRIELGEEVARPLKAMVRAIGTACRETGVPGAVASINPESMPGSMRQQVIDEGLLPLQGLHDAGVVLGKWTAYATEARGHLAEITPPLRPPPLAAQRDAIILDEHASKQQLAAYGVPVPRAICTDRGGLVAAVGKLTAPLVLKALHEDLLHKTDAGAVAMSLCGPEEIVEAAEQIRRSVARYRTGLSIDRFLVEEMAPPPLAELLVGVRVDPHFGPVMVLAAGGVMVELMRDAQRLLLPATPRDIAAALRRLKAFPLLDGFRGRPRADLDAIVQAIASIARYALDHHGQLLELDVNPLFVYPAGEGALAVDALILRQQPPKR